MSPGQGSARTFVVAGLAVTVALAASAWWKLRTRPPYVLKPIKVELLDAATFAGGGLHRQLMPVDDDGRRTNGLVSIATEYALVARVLQTETRYDIIRYELRQKFTPDGTVKVYTFVAPAGVALSNSQWVGGPFGAEGRTP